MLIIGLDYHPSFQQIAFVDDETGEFSERQLLHKDGEAADRYGSNWAFTLVRTLNSRTRF